MTLYLIGLGLGDHKDITVRGLEAVRSCDRVFLENYTSILGVDKSALEEFYGCTVEMADRTTVESEAETILSAAKAGSAAMLVVGDPFGATTHSDLAIRAVDMGIKVDVIHNASIMNAVACTGLQLYRFGHTVSICFFRPEWKPDSFYDRMAGNRNLGMHTLALLDIKVKEPDFEAMMRGKTKFLPPRYMSVATCCQQLLETEQRRGEGASPADCLVIGVARVGQPTQAIVYGTLEDMCAADLGEPLHSVVIAGDLDEMEGEMLKWVGTQCPGSDGVVERAVAQTEAKRRAVAEAFALRQKAEEEAAEAAEETAAAAGEA